MGNNLVGIIIDKMRKYDPNKTIVKIWNMGNLSIIYACNNPENWMGEMDPYFAFNGEMIDGIGYADNVSVFHKVCTDKNLIYDITEE